MIAYFVHVCLCVLLYMYLHTYTYICMFVGWTDVCLPSIVYVYLFSYTLIYTPNLLYCTQNACVCVSRNPLAHNLPFDGHCMPFERVSACVCACRRYAALGINIKREMRATINHRVEFTEKIKDNFIEWICS